MAKREYIFEAVETFEEVISIGWVHVLTGTNTGETTSITVHRDKGERFIVRGIEQRKLWETDQRYRRVS